MTSFANAYAYGRLQGVVRLFLDGHLDREALARWAADIDRDRLAGKEAADWLAAYVDVEAP